MSSKIPDIASWAESPAGFYLADTKKPIKLAAHQAAILRHVFEVQPDGRLRYDEVVYSTPKKGGKTCVGALVSEYFSLFFEPPNEVYLIANSLEQSQGRAYKALERSIQLNPVIGPRTTLQTKLILLDNQTSIIPLSSDYAGAAGSNHGLTLWDELWAYTTEGARRLWDEMTPVPTRKVSLRFIVTYAGFTAESNLLEELYQRGQAGEPVPELAHIENGEGKPACMQNGRTFVYWDHELKPHPGLTVTPDVYHQEQRRTLRPAAYLRLHENRWTTNESPFITPEQWAACYSNEVKPVRLGETRRMVLGADASTSRDLTALVGTIWNEETQTTDVVYSRVWKPMAIAGIRLGRPTVDLSETIGAEILRLHEAGCVDACYYDPYQLHSIAVDLAKAGVPMQELPQTAARTEADQALYDAVIGKLVRHYDDPILNDHVENAIAIETPRGFRLAKEKTSKKIDAAVALSMSHYGALANKGAGGWGYIPDLFEDADRPEGAFYISILRGMDFIWCWPGTDKHRPGQSYQNHHFKKEHDGEYYACGACVRELEAAGYYAQLEKERAAAENTVPLSENEYLEWRLNLRRFKAVPLTQEEQIGKLGFELMKRQARKDINHVQ